MIAIFPEIHRCIESQDTEKLAILARLYFGGAEGRHPAIKPENLVMKSGIRLEVKASPYMGALMTRESGGSFLVTIITHPKVGGFEKAFTIAHLFGHYFLDIQKELVDSMPKNRGIGEDISPLLRYEGQLYDSKPRPGTLPWKEKKADEFAAALLMPKGMLLKSAKILSDTRKIAELFSVSPSSVRQRCAGLGLNLPDLSHDQKNPEHAPHRKTPPLISHRPRSVHEQSPPPADSGQKPLKRLRQLAKKLDDSVEI